GAPAPAPAASTAVQAAAPAAVPGGAGQWGPTRAVADRLGIALPAALPQTDGNGAGHARQFLGSWVFSNPESRSIIMVVPWVDAASGRASVIWGMSAPGPREAMSASRRRESLDFIGRLNDGTLEFGNRWTMRARIEGPSRMRMEFVPPADDLTTPIAVGHFTRIE
ncbi:hypothetical protein, partial [Falsiroseomonas oryzae]|uniref:hypothetical protein n=1 Tax=Falsiroseomonas oryzae TaxID=2766473 RepID=UPI0022EAAB56